MQTNGSLFRSHGNDGKGLGSFQVFSSAPHKMWGLSSWFKMMAAYWQQPGWRKVQRRKGQPELSHVATLSVKGGWRCNLDSGWLCAWLKCQGSLPKED